MATTNKGIYYPNNYSNVADVPEDMKKLAESVDTVVGNLDTNKVDKVDGKGLSTNDYTNEDKAKLDSLENYDDTEITQEIEDIQANDAKQDELIQKLKDNSINVTTDEATSLQVQDASTLPAKLDVRGNQRQEVTETQENIFNGKLESGAWDYTSGQKVDNATQMRSVDYIDVSGQTQISIVKKDGGTFTVGVRYYADDKTYIGRASINNVTDAITTTIVNNIDDTKSVKYATLTFTQSTDTSEVFGLNKGADLTWHDFIPNSPSLDYPSKVRAVGDNGSVEIKKLTENVIDLSKSVALYNTEITEIDKENGIIKVHRTNTQDPSIEINCNLPAGQYSLLHNSHNFVQISLKYGTNKERVEDIGSEKYKTFYAEKGITKLVIYSGSELPTDYEINFSDIILVMGNVAREDIKYVKYQESSYILDIQKPMLSGDYFVKEADGWKEVHIWEKDVLTGNENIVYYNAPNAEKANTFDTAYFTIQPSKNGIASGEIGTVNSNMFKNIYSANGIWGNTADEVEESIAIDTTIRIRVNKTRLTGYTNDLSASEKVELFKQLLQQKNTEGNPVYAYYGIATPTKLPCTDEQSAILDQLSELPLFAGTNNIITAESLALMQMQYIADTETYIDNRIDEKLANINQQILELAGGN